MSITLHSCHEYESQNSSYIRAALGTSEGSYGDCIPSFSTVDATKALTRGLEVILDHHRASMDVISSMKSSVESFLDNSESEGIWLRKAKYLLTYPLALYLKNDKPKSPSGEFSPQGVFKRWMKNRLSVFNRSNTHLWFSWLQAKRCSLPVSDTIVEDTYRDHLKLLTTPDQGDSALIEEIFEDHRFVRILNGLRNEVKKVKDLDFTSYEPSKNAAFGYSRSSGGQQANLLDLVSFDDIVPYDTVVEPELSFMRYIPYSVKSGTSIVQEVYEPQGRLIWSRLKTLDLKRSTLSCTIQAVLEPMKVRVISKGEALNYYYSRSLQKIMHGYLRKIPCFRLIGRPFDPLDLMDLAIYSKPGYQWFSIDYSAATDNLSWKYSGRIFEYIIQDLPDDYKEVVRTVLGPHNLYYPSKDSGKYGVLKGLMQRGQLMGSILSFPILCLANLGLYLRVTRNFHQGDDAIKSVLINGDDMLYAAPPCLWNKHVEMGRKIGLEMSLGKAYMHPTYANVNSVSCHYDLSRPYSIPKRIDFLNVGLLFGQHKVQNRELASEHSSRNSGSVTSCLSEVIKGCFRDHNTIIMKYLDIHKEEIREESRCYVTEKKNNRRVRRPIYRNIFLPLSIGGMGVTPVKSFRFFITKDQKNLARSIYESYCYDRLFVDTQMPLRGHCPKEYLEFEKVPWSRLAENIPEERSFVLNLSESTPSFSSIKSGIFISLENPNHKF